MSKEQWAIKEWVVSNGDVFFHLEDIKFVLKIPEFSIRFCFEGGVVDILFGDQYGRDHIFDWVYKARLEMIEAQRNLQDMHRALTRAQVEIQNRIAGHVTDKH